LGGKGRNKEERRKKGMKEKRKEEKKVRSIWEIFFITPRKILNQYAEDLLIYQSEITRNRKT
jgi:hypothetical protein